MSATPYPGPWRLEQDVKWPFQLHVLDAEGKLVVQAERIAYSTGQKTLTDVRLATGFKSAEVHVTREAIAVQEASMELIAKAPVLEAALIEALTKMEKLKADVKRLRKEKARLVTRLDAAKRSPDFFAAEGNRGGSYVRIDKVYGPDFKTVQEGMVRLEVGETCVRTVQEKISVVALAAILTHCKDKGFQTVVNEYLRHACGTPAISTDCDTLPSAT